MTMGKQTIHAAVFKDAESDQWVAVCLEFDVVTQGDSEQHARDMIREAVELYLQDLSREDYEMLYQPISGEPRLHELEINAPSLLSPRS